MHYPVYYRYKVHETDQWSAWEQVYAKQEIRVFAPIGAVIQISYFAPSNL